jgi:uncharacterized protein YbaA (DUF1428 family)
MAKYVDGFVVPVPKRNINEYKKMARLGGKIWREHGALQYCEAVGEDLDIKFGMPFPKGIKTKPGETVIFAWIVYKSRKHRDQVNEKVMKDPRLQGPKPKMPFDFKRMLYGGFDIVVDA